MKKLISTISIFASIFAYSQVTFGLRTNAIFNTSSASWRNLGDTFNGAINSKGNNISGFNVGLAAKINSPISSWFIMPEIYYTSFKNKNTVDNVELEAKSNRIDVPVMIGRDFLSGKLAAFVGPIASYNLSGNKTYSNFKEDSKNEFTVGYQFGAQATLSNFVFNVRYEGAFSKDTRVFKSIAGQEIRYDSRPSIFVLGIGYNFK